MGARRMVAAGLAACTVLAGGAAAAQALTALATADPGVVVEVSGIGRVQAPGIDCPGDCTASYASGTRITLSASTRNGSTFAGWSGSGPCANAGTKPTCTIDVTQDVLVRAAFSGGTADPEPSPSPSPSPQPSPSPSPQPSPTVSPSPSPTASPSPSPSPQRRTRLGTRFADVVRGTSRAERFLLGAGDDQAFGGRGDDVLCGEAGADRLHGDAGADVLHGDTCPGRARVRRPAQDRLLGGAGDDLVVARDGVRDLVDCGPGRDRVIADLLDRLRRCERVTRR